MKLKYYLLVGLTALLFSPSKAVAQSNGSNSPYSRFGIGLVSDQSQSFNRSMGGVAQGLRYGGRVNFQNPASYSAIDSLSFIFDISMSLQRDRFAQNGNHQSTNNTSFDNLNAGFRLLSGLGMSVGFVPYSRIGYTFSKESYVLRDPYSNQIVTQDQGYTGSGGLRQIYLGVGWSPFKGFSVGANGGYLWGDVSNGVTQSFSENGTANTSSYGGLLTVYTASLRTWKVDAGVQYSFNINKENELTLGATVGVGHKIGGEATMLRISLNGDTIVRTANKAFQLPMTYSLGAAWRYKQMLTVAADVAMEQWSNCVTPKIVNNGNDANATQYVVSTGSYSNRYKANAGAEFIPDRYGNSYFKRINYRFGGYYSTPYLKINGQDGSREYGLTAGIGLPIMNRWNSRSLVNVGVQWSHRSASSSSMITENIFCINIGLTFNEPWFMKWKFN
ncbi:MAG: hypothetical protein IKO85_03355 [Bacteroidaceae bacterium]|nr:hypothetical protein [Bacteroidaceae bacterium]